MSPDQIVRAWKDAEYGVALSAEARDEVPAHPVGSIDIADAALDVSAGDDERTEYMETLGCCQGFTQLGKCDFTAGGGPGGPCSWLCFTIWWTTDRICAAS